MAHQRESKCHVFQHRPYMRQTQLLAVQPWRNILDVAVPYVDSWHYTPLTVLCLQQELGMSVNIVEKNFLKDPSVLETDEFKKINPAGKCVCQITLRPERVSMHVYMCIATV